ncbi:MAG: DNA-processing protein DprA [Acidimicrobiales bacterium]
MTESEDRRFAAALAALGLSPARLRRILAGTSPQAAWEALRTGTHPEDADGRARHLVRHDIPDLIERRCSAQALSVLVHGDTAYPQRLSADPEAPAVLFVKGDGERLGARPSVAIVGTRSATTIGRSVAHDLGHHLASEGVTVVSGLAPGIDVAALDGALHSEGPPAVAVLGTAHGDERTPEQRRIASALAERGVVVSELAPGADSARWRFAVRNRIMAALADVVVVVECHESGGALHTVRAARRRGVPVAAVPGSVRNPAAAGTNTLLSQGAHCVSSADDVLALVGGNSVAPRPARERSTVRGPSPARPTPLSPSESMPPADESVLRALDHEPATFEVVVLRSGIGIGACAAALERLVADNVVCSEKGFWWKR